ncbi:nucleotidyltransferase family protein [Vibrio tubiashii]|uniref:nucleotidyltransferase family protein n=1 Tax=Vibrio tubiashii TaxID=29498 RepID=UPI001EFD67F9|nr:nucleotidyltransferase family protein [Vibrio tubiashii]MCG9580254.1 nucleotidyltransferase family protein [Vibrio tubiashii]MCG9613845.1 nucleotidyltransferase family protein [Vibrio tubiashii]MCG9686822.1 nucleotidyltransferase family protein [Vibrio tubiashii]
MQQMHFEKQLIDLTQADPIRIQALKCVAELCLPDCYIAAGFVRNLVWDSLHHQPEPTPLNDVDVIYFDSSESNSDRYLEYEQQLRLQMPNLNWQVRNQALMHTRNGDAPYRNSVDAMGYWPEKETAIGIRLNDKLEYECVSAFGLDSLFDLKISHNPARPKNLFVSRVEGKNWLATWPLLKVTF